MAQLEGTPATERYVVDVIVSTCKSKTKKVGLDARRNDAREMKRKSGMNIERNGKREGVTKRTEIKTDRLMENRK